MFHVSRKNLGTRDSKTRDGISDEFHPILLSEYFGSSRYQITSNSIIPADIQQFQFNYTITDDMLSLIKTEK